LTGAQGNINNALNGLVYTPAAGVAGSSVTLTVTTNDQGYSGTSGGPRSDTKTVTLRYPINAAPVNSVPAAQSLNENTPLTFSGARLISISDPDAGGAT